MADEKKIIEAALFISSRPMALEEFRTLTGIGALGFLRDTIDSLKKDYEGRAVEILEAEGKFEMRVRQEYLEKVKQYAQESEISKSALRTLAYLSRHDGILKSDLVKRVGTGAYLDVHELVDNGFVKAKKSGRTSKLILTDKFKRYFSVKELSRQQTIGEASVIAPDATAQSGSGEEQTLPGDDHPDGTKTEDQMTL